MSKEIHGKYTEPDILKFKKEEVQKTIEWTIKNPDSKGVWWGGYKDDERGMLKVQDSKEPTILIVGDDGVYIMPGGSGIWGKDTKLAYAEGCNPNKDDFDDWWALKGNTWGGDDGIESLKVKEIQPILDKCKTHLIVAFKEEDGKDVFDITHD